MKFMNPSVLAVVIVLLAMIAGSSIYVVLDPGAAPPEVSTPPALGGKNASPSLAEASHQTAQTPLRRGSASQKLPAFDQAARALPIVQSRPAPAALFGAAFNHSSFANKEPRSSSSIEPAQNRPAFVQSHADVFDLSNANQHRAETAGVGFRLGSAVQRSGAIGGMTKKEASLPLVLHEIDLATLPLDEAQVKLLNSLRDTFVYEVGGENQDPGDAGYAERWNTAQPKSDASVRLFFGSEIAGKMQLQAAQARYAETHALNAR